MNQGSGQKFFASGYELREYVRQLSDGTAILSFSCGKESICAWLELRKTFKRIVPYYLYLVPGLEFIEDSLRYYEDFFQTPIVRLPHPSLFRLLDNAVFQTPERSRLLDQLSFQRSLDYSDIYEYMRERVGSNAFIAIGVRETDSPQRLMAIRKHGPINYNRGTFYPLYDWKKRDIIECLEREGCKLPYDYKIFGRSFDGIDYRFLKPIKDNLPRDYERILKWFPLAELTILQRASEEANHG